MVHVAADWGYRIENPMPVTYHLFPTSFGTCGIAWSERGLTRVQLPEPTDAQTEARLRRGGDRASRGALPALASQAIDAMTQYLSGNRVSFDKLQLDESDIPPFNAAIYRVLRRVPQGTTVTYGELAKQQGEPGAARAVGVAMSKNPWPIIVPCHRVLGADGKLTGFSAYGGLVTKLKLLTLEGVHLSRNYDLFE